MIRYEVQFLTKSSGEWRFYDSTEDYQRASEMATYLNSVEYDARIIRVVSTDVEVFPCEKEEA